MVRRIGFQVVDWRKRSVVSHRYIRKALGRLENWLTVLKTGTQGIIYQMRHHNCGEDDVPRDAYGKPLKFAVPYGEGGPIERMNAGDISWKAALIWIVLKFHSDLEDGCHSSDEHEDAGEVNRFWQTDGLPSNQGVV